MALTKFHYLLWRLVALKFLIYVQEFRYPLRGELPQVQIFVTNGPNPLTWDYQLLRYRLRLNAPVYQVQLANLNHNLRGNHSYASSKRGAKGVEKSPRLNWATQFLTMAYDSTCSPNMFFRITWIFFGAFHCRKKLYYSLRLDIVEIVRIAWHASFRSL